MKRMLCALIAALLSICSTSAQAAHVSSVAERTRVNLTVYNGGSTLVHDTRRMTLPAGDSTISWRDVSSNIDQASVVLDTVDGAPVDMIEQNYNFDVLNPDALMSRYLGKTVYVIHDPVAPGGREVREPAKILSLSGGIVLQYHDRIETQVRGRIVYPLAIGAIRDRPTLDLNVASRGGSEELDLSYMTSGIGWQADYVGVLNADASLMDLHALVTLTNTSGTAYENARLQLVAGNVNVAPPNQMQLKTIATVSARSAAQETLFEYHLYTLPLATTILNQQTKQVSLFNAHAIPVHSTYTVRGSPGYYQTQTPDLGERIPVGVSVVFENRGGELGIPLPAGTVRVYENDSHGLSQFAGSVRIGHTPKNETVTLPIGGSFDIVASKKQTDFKLITNCESRSSYSVELHNDKDVPVSIGVVEPIPGDWKITSESAPHDKSSSRTASWLLDLPPNGRSQLTYTADVKWCVQ